jgi:hypothetical protein
MKHNDVIIENGKKKLCENYYNELLCSGSETGLTGTMYSNKNPPKNMNRNHKFVLSLKKKRPVEQERIN